MPALADAGYTIVAPDLRGFGYSDKPLDGFDVGTVAEDIRQVIAKLGRDREKVRIVGHDAYSPILQTSRFVPRAALPALAIEPLGC
jgi:pimeloyl-ACP methyl ester carboxylesterase